MAPDSNVKRQTKRKFPWLTARKWVQGLSLAAFLGLVVMAHSQAWPADLVNLTMRLDPLTSLAHLLSSRTFLAGSAVALLVVLLTIVFGRAWCGWLCPLGTTLDIFTPRKTKNTAAPRESLRSVKYILLLVILFAALLGNLTLLFLDPLTIMVRTFSIAAWPGVDQIFTSFERAAYQLPFMDQPLTTLDGWLRPALFPASPLYYREAWLFGALLVGLLALNWIVPRFWCRYLCPLGGMLGLLSKFALFRREVGEDCKGCAVCSHRCPTGTIDPQRAFASDPSECTMCLDCLDSCPRSTVNFVPRLKPAAWQKYDPTRRQVLLSLGAALGGLAILRSDALVKREDKFLLRPPGARENKSISKCIRCGLCIRACPTTAIQPAFLEGGLEGMSMPLVVPRQGYCDYSCTACGEVCPVEAIPQLNLEEKRSTIIGKAYIDQNRCIAWSDHIDCIVCEEMCPVADKAVTLEPTEFKQEDGTIVTIQLPHVIRDRCIGCGICEYKCPVSGEAAIRVYLPEAPAL